MRTEILQVPGKPYLIQRGTFKSVNGDAIEGIDSLINYDYMGSSEFEWGALPQSLNRMVSYWGSYVMVETPLKDLDSQLCYLLCYDKHSDVVRETLGILFSKEGREKIYTKEWTDMYLYISGTLSSYLKTDFWWDVENDWMCCFGLYNLQRLIRAMRLVCRKKAQKIKNCTTCSHAILCAKVELKDHKEICIQKGYEYHLVKFSTFPEVGPKEIDGSHFKPQRTLIEKDGPLLKIKQMDGRDVTINLRKVQDVDVELDRVTVMVLNRQNQLRKVFIKSPDRAQVIYDQCKEWKDLNKARE